MTHVSMNFKGLLWDLNFKDKIPSIFLMYNSEAKRQGHLRNSYGILDYLLKEGKTEVLLGYSSKPLHLEVFIPLLHIQTK